MSEPDYETERITIRRILDSEGGDHVFVEWSEDGRLIELLGMVEYARDTILRAYMDDDEDET